MVTTKEMVFMKSAHHIIAQFKSQNPGKNRTWDLTDPKLHYLSIAQSQDYLSLRLNKTYFSGMHSQELALLEQSVSSIIKSLPDSFAYIDFGPGSGDKSEILLKEAKNQNKEISYHGIDISETILDCAMDNISKLKIPIKGYVGDFIKDFKYIREMIENENVFIYLGATFGNFPIKNILNHIHQTITSRDRIYVSAQLCLEDMTPILNQYHVSDESPLYMQTLKQLGFKPSDLELTSRYNRETQYVEVCAKVKNISPYLEKIMPERIKSGDMIVHSMTLKPTDEYFKKSITNLFSDTAFYSTDRFIGAVIKK
jgi:hypothetical protein